jgi:hypothetical protein
MPATPGPWRFDRKSGFVEKATEKPFETVVCFIRGSAEDEEACANGALIAAAPTLLHMIKWCVSHDGESLGDHPELLDAARAAIIKAKGETPQ